MRNGLSGVLGGPRQTKGLWSVEGDGSSDLSLGSRIGSNESGLFSIFGLGFLRRRSLGLKQSQHGIEQPRKAIVLEVFPLVDFVVAIWIQSRRLSSICEEEVIEGGDWGERNKRCVHPNASIAIHRQNCPTSAQQLPTRHLRCGFSHPRVRF